MPADRPYQSHLLSFLNRQVQVAKDRTGVIWRTVKLSVSTAFQLGIQGILYPFYAVMKAARLVGKQISQAEGMANFWLRAEVSELSELNNDLSSDAPINAILTAITQRQIASTTVGDADELTLVLVSGMAIQGVASRLHDRRLVLITPTQKVLDILSESQEAAILRRISYEVALYLRWLRSRTLMSSRASRFFLNSTKSKRLPTGAISTGRSTQLDKLQQNHPSIRIPSLWQNRTELGFFSLPNLQDLPSLRELPNLFQAAFKYFFGRSVLGLTSAPSYYVRATAPALEGALFEPLFEPLPDPWLSSDDLFRDLGETLTMRSPQSQILQAANTPIAKALPAANSTEAFPLRSIIVRFIQSFFNSFTTPSIASPVKSSSEISHTPPGSFAFPIAIPPLEGNHSIESDHSIESFNCTPVFTPDWTEVEAQSMGYDRSWLDRCVAWLDNLLAHIEKTFLTIWASLSSLFRSR